MLDDLELRGWMGCVGACHLEPGGGEITDAGCATRKTEILPNYDVKCGILQARLAGWWCGVGSSGKE